ncbi:MAG: nucleotide sugar dehydrogenase [Candidatus Nanopelagicales bacterium]|nr:nucleotide sugar dehydrogenase [Candidatus Nanopelagicales bacterium]
MTVVIVGGCGHVGLPLGLALANAGVQTTALDLDAAKVRRVMSGEMPFLEPDTTELLTAVLAAGSFAATTDPTSITEADTIIVVIGTPVDEHLNPEPDAVVHAIDDCLPFMRDGQLMILRSTIFPGVTKKIENHLAKSGKKLDLSFCPERIAEGFALEELSSLPQVVGARTESAFFRSEELFTQLGAEPVRVTPEEAELAKLFTNSWRYIKFAIANQFYVMATNAGVDYENVRHAITHNYPRAKDLPRAGFAAGPCLLKDTMQLAAFSNNAFHLGHSAMLVNEGLPLFLVEQMEKEHDLSTLTVGILGMAFKGDSDDPRSSLSYKLRRILRFRAQEVLCADPHMFDDLSFVSQEELLQRCDIVVIGAPHTAYKNLEITQPLFDIWKIVGLAQ